MSSADVTADSVLSALNEPQRDAVTSTRGPVLVLAGAGSGKTRVIAHRIAYLLGVERVDPRRVLAVTFTNKAAEEMRRRVEDLVLPAGIRPPLIATFHSACVRILRERSAQAGLPPSFVIYDEDDRVSVVKEGMRALDFDEKALTPAQAVHRISHAKNQMLPPSQVEQLARTPREERIAALYRLYEERLRAAGAVDFDDLLLRVVQLFENRPERARVVSHDVAATSSSTSTRTPTGRSTASSASSPRSTGTSAWWAIPISRCTAGEAPTCGTSSTSRRTIPTAAWSVSSRTTAPPSASSTSPPP